MVRASETQGQSTGKKALEMPHDSNKHVSITGASGTIVMALVRYRHDRYDVTCLTHRPTAIPGVPGERVHAADISDLDAILPVFRGVDAAVHLAASPDVQMPWEDVLHNSIVGTRNVIILAPDIESITPNRCALQESERATSWPGSGCTAGAICGQGRLNRKAHPARG